MWLPEICPIGVTSGEIISLSPLCRVFRFELPNKDSCFWLNINPMFKIIFIYTMLEHWFFWLLTTYHAFLDNINYYKTQFKNHLSCHCTSVSVSLFSLESFGLLGFNETFHQMKKVAFDFKSVALKLLHCRAFWIWTLMNSKCNLSNQSFVKNYLNIFFTYYCLLSN